MYFLTVIVKPLVVILNYSTEAVLKILRVQKISEPLVTEEEIKFMLEKRTESGGFEKAELSMIEGVFDIRDRRVASLMTHRNDIIALNLYDPVDKNLQKMIASGRSNFQVYESDLDTVVGMVSVKVFCLERLKAILSILEN